MKKITLALASLILTYSCTSAPRYIKKSKIMPNSHKAKDAPYVLVISIDGYRWDYTKKYQPKFLKEFQKNSASLKSLRPSFPTKTFPNHLSIMTGRYPMNHGIVANYFYAPDLALAYSIKNSKAVTNDNFYLSKPLWSLAEEQGMRTATYFWPGSEAKINNQRPSYYLKYAHNTEHKYRISTVKSWFELPEDKRPHLVTLYFSDVDSAGHKYGPDSKQVRQAIHKVDRSIEKLVNNLKELKLPINVVIVSDHGMAKTDINKVERLSKNQKTTKLLNGFVILGGGPITHLYTSKENSNSIRATLSSLNKSAKNFKCYTKDQTPKRLNFSKSSRIGDIVCIANRQWSIAHHDQKLPKGNHGWSQYDQREMHAIFYAQGPNFKKSFVHTTQDNISIYPLLAKILKLEVTHKIDGNIDNMSPLLK